MNLDLIINKIISRFNPDEKILIAMSGGVDSSVTAWAALQAGCRVEGVTLKLFDTENNFWEDAEKIATFLNIKWHLADYRKFFNEDIISNYISMYKRGLTPNPCCTCNRIGKTKYLFDEMQAAGADRIATGHYAGMKEHNGRQYVSKAGSAANDQSYYLSLIEPFHIEKLIYPLSVVENKSLVREIAKKAGLPVAEKKDSYETCFLMGKDYREYLKEKGVEPISGDFYLEGKRIGPHKGTYNYTIGQRRGLDVSHTKPLFVKNIDNKTGNVELTVKEGIFKRGVRLIECVLPSDLPIMFRGTAKLRHKMEDAPCMVECQFGNKAVLLFDDPQFAPAPGQVAAIYIDDRVVGGGIVDSWF